MLADVGIESVKLPPRSPNLNAYAERFVKTIKESCLERMIFFGEDSLRNAVREFVERYHLARNHQGLGNAPIVSFQVYLRATLSSRCGASPPRVGQYSHLPSLVTHVEAPLGTLSRNFVTSPVGDTLNTVIPLDV